MTDADWSGVELKSGRSVNFFLFQAKENLFAGKLVVIPLLKETAATWVKWKRWRKYYVQRNTKHNLLLTCEWWRKSQSSRRKASPRLPRNYAALAIEQVWLFAKPLSRKKGTSRTCPIMLLVRIPSNRFCVTYIVYLFLFTSCLFATYINHDFYATNSSLLFSIIIVLLFLFCNHYHLQTYYKFKKFD